MMKRFLLIFTALLFSAGVITGQNLKTTLNKADKTARDAIRALEKFTADNSQKDLLVEALDHAKAAVNMIDDITAEELDQAYAKDRHARRAKRDVADIWESAGKVYLEIANQISTANQLNLDKSDIPTLDYPALKAADALKNALSFTDRNFQIRNIVNTMTTAQGALNNMGSMAFENSQDYPRAYLNFNEALVLHDLIQREGGTSILETEAALQDQRYFAGLSALNAQMSQPAAALFQKLYDDQYDNALVYEAMYKVNKEDDIEKAYAYLEAGRKKYPEDVGLLFAEINHFLELKKLDELIGKLETAIEKEPENVSLYATLGNVYDNLFQREMKAGADVKAEEYFNQALSNFQRALEKNPDFFDAIYSIGTLYYNRAAILVEKLQGMEDDYSKEGLKKYEAMKEKIFEQFNEALPYFKQCEQLNPNDVNTLIALREIYARKDQLDMAEVFKERLEKVQNGESFDNSYFQE